MSSIKKIIFYFALLVQTIVHFSSLADHVSELWSSQNCNIDTTNCSVKNFSLVTKKFNAADGNVLLLASQSHLLIEDKNKYVVLKGDVLIDSATNYTIRTEHGVLKGDKGIALITRSKSHTIVKAFEGEYLLVLRGQNEQVKLPSGFKYKFYGINSKGSTQAMFPEVLKVNKDYIALFELGHKHLQTLEPRLMSSIDNLSAAVEAQTVMKFQIVERKIAEHKAEELRKKQLAMQRQKEKEGLIRLIKQKNYLDY